MSDSNKLKTSFKQIKKVFKKLLTRKLISDKIRKSLEGDKINEEMVFEN